jgi:hypothetical protein
MHMWSKVSSILRLPPKKLQHVVYKLEGARKGQFQTSSKKLLRMTCLVVEGIAHQEALGKERVAVTF